MEIKSRGSCAASWWVDTAATYDLWQLREGKCWCWLKKPRFGIMMWLNKSQVWLLSSCYRALLKTSSQNQKQPERKCLRLHLMWMRGNKHQGSSTCMQMPKILRHSWHYKLLLHMFLFLKEETVTTWVYQHKLLKFRTLTTFIRKGKDFHSHFAVMFQLTWLN